ncbi:MAG TPA: hypothetical protein VFX96_07225 [Pyrinomonadaceae bacterium]|nr:hypothetical protein [Pyrinomonadaceae bacterium]
MTRAIVLSASLLFSLASARAQTRTPRAPADSAKAAEILARLDGLHSLSGAGLDSAELNKHMRKVLPFVSKRIARMSDGDLKSDLAASLHFFEHALDADDDARPTACDKERPGAYASLCERAGGKRRTLLLAKSRLRASWARAELNRPRVGDDDSWADEVSGQSGAEHAFERELASEAVASLRRLEERVFVYDSLAGFEDGRELARVPYERFRAELETSSARLRRILQWLPPGAPREEIRKATQAYLDGAWWWSKTRRALVVRVAANSFAEDADALAPRVSEATARYTVALHWRQARDFTRRAERLMTSAH